MKAATTRATAPRPVGTNTKDPELIRDRREQLIRAALEVFQEKGFHATTVRDIGRAAGLTQGTIYNYVRSKEDILFLVCDRVIAEYISSMEAAAAATGDPGARLREALRRVTRVMIEQSSAILLVHHESHNLDRRSLRSLLARVQGWINQFEDLVEDGLGREHLPTSKLSLLTNIVTFLPTLIALRAWSLPKDLTQEQYTDWLVEFMMRGLGLVHLERNC
ncbi:MAG TPA: TetR/AcrR family transcriptional regulator [Steroidobacteraceae bacterium]|jgi:AcrR family transcriptional regulator|nr:TetR/AcrR family transcriptional regulator [Steroidobacteraceae bacterium]